MATRLGRSWGGGSFNPDEIFDGDVWRLEEDVDFTGKVTTLRTRLHNLANDRGLKLRTRVVRLDNNLAGLEVQAYRPREKAA